MEFDIASECQSDLDAKKWLLASFCKFLPFIIISNYHSCRLRKSIFKLILIPSLNLISELGQLSTDVYIDMNILPERFVFLSHLMQYFNIVICFINYKINFIKVIIWKTEKIFFGSYYKALPNVLMHIAFRQLVQYK